MEVSKYQWETKYAQSKCYEYKTIFYVDFKQVYYRVDK